MRFLICTLVFFLYIFSIEFSFIPFLFRQLFALIGAVLLYKDRKYLIGYITKSKYWGLFFFLLVLIVILALFSAFINSYFDSHFFKYPFKVFLSFSSAYFYLFILSYIWRKGPLTENQLISFYIGACVIQCVIAVFFFLEPQVRDVALGVLKTSDLGAESLEDGNLDVRRLIGFGAAWFSAGTIFMMAIFLSFVKLLRAQGSLDMIKYFLFAAIILVVGSMIARTTLVGAVVSLLYLLLSKGSIKYKIRAFLVVAVMIVVFYIIYINYLETNPVFELAFQRAFSLLYDYQSSGELTGLQAYTDKIYPEELQTWIIGDGKMADPKTPTTAYYMGIDIGISRVIFGLGILGLIVYSLIQLFMCMLSKLGRIEALSLFVAYIILMNKGLFSFDLIIAPFVMLNIFNHIGIEKNKRLNHIIQSTLPTSVSNDSKL